jgi:hypothetical protein
MTLEIDRLSSLTHQPESNYRQAEKQRNSIGLAVLIACISSSGGLLISLLNLSMMSSLANKPLPTLVQTSDGKTMQIAALQGKERSANQIQQFTLTSLTGLFTWRQKLLPSNAEEERNPKIDPGVPIEVNGVSGQKIPTPVWGASFALGDRIRQDFLAQELAPLMEKLKVLQGASEVAIVPINIQAPEAVNDKSGEKIWKVRVVANLAVRANPNVPETLVPFNKTIYVRAVEVPAIDRNSATRDPAKDLNFLIAKNRPGLEIYAIEDFEAQNITPVVSPSPTSSPTSQDKPAAAK